MSDAIRSDAPMTRPGANGDRNPGGLRRKPKWILRDRDRHGNERWYFRRRGEPRIRLPGGPGHPHFAKAYHAALNGEQAAPRAPKVRQIQPWKVGGYVYFLRVADLIKIGFSKRPGQRLISMKTALPQPVTSFVYVAATVRDERALHKLFENRRSAGEWFRLSPMLQSYMAFAAANGHLPANYADVEEQLTSASRAE